VAAPDITTKFLLERYAADFLRLAGVSVGRRPVRVVDADLATVSAAADKVVQLGVGHRAVIVHVEFQVGSDRWLDDRVLFYHAALRRRHRLPVRSIVFALRRSAVPPSVRGRVVDAGDGRTRLDFAYQLVRAYALAPADLLAGGVGTLPLLGVSMATRGELPSLLRAARRRLDDEVPPADAAELWAATDILLGLRYNDAVAAAMIGVVSTMRESSVYQRILREGRTEGQIEGERRLLIRMATSKFGPAPAETAARLQALADPDELDRLGVRLLKVATWDELLGS
jgi:predicted transposase YdaD